MQELLANWNEYMTPLLSESDIDDIVNYFKEALPFIFLFMLAFKGIKEKVKNGNNLISVKLRHFFNSWN